MLMNSLSFSPEGENGVGDELPGTMVGDVSASFDGYTGDVTSSKETLRDEDMFLIAPPADRKHVGMLDQKKAIRDKVFNSRPMNTMLQCQTLLEVHPVQIDGEGL